VTAGALRVEQIGRGVLDGAALSKNVTTFRRRVRRPGLDTIEPVQPNTREYDQAFCLGLRLNPIDRFLRPKPLGIVLSSQPLPKSGHAGAAGTMVQTPRKWLFGWVYSGSAESRQNNQWGGQWADQRVTADPTQPPDAVLILAQIGPSLDQS
jgi:hypothetical protein